MDHLLVEYWISNTHDCGSAVWDIGTGGFCRGSPFTLHMLGRKVVLHKTVRSSPDLRVEGREVFDSSYGDPQYMGGGV